MNTYPRHLHQKGISQFQIFKLHSYKVINFTCIQAYGLAISKGGGGILGFMLGALQYVCMLTMHFTVNKYLFLTVPKDVLIQSYFHVCGYSLTLTICMFVFGFLKYHIFLILYQGWITLQKSS